MLSISDWDLKFFGYFNGLARKNKLLDLVFIFFARYYTIVMSAGAFVYLALYKPDLSLKALIISQLMVLLVARGMATELIRLFFKRKRPFLAHRVVQLIKKYSEASFPSGHTISIMAIGFGLMPFDPVTGWFMVLSGFVIGLARIVAGVHYPLDVLAGLILSWPSAWFGLLLYNYFFK